MRLLLAAFLVFSACAPTAPPAPASPPASDASAGPDRTLAGTVAAIDLDPMSYDADGVVTVRTSGGDTVRVLLPARYNLCAATYDDWSDLAVGDAVEARGVVTSEGAVRPCESAEHYFRRH
jgi:hypothetical protein